MYIFLGSFIPQQSARLGLGHDTLDTANTRVERALCNAESVAMKLAVRCAR